VLGANKVIKVWDLTTHKLVTSLEAHQDNIWSLKSFENLLISGSEDKTIQVFIVSFSSSVLFQLQPQRTFNIHETELQFKLLYYI
jgi:WD40 repeat protein